MHKNIFFKYNDIYSVAKEHGNSSINLINAALFQGDSDRRHNKGNTILLLIALKYLKPYVVQLVTTLVGSDKNFNRLPQIITYPNCPPPSLDGNISNNHLPWTITPNPLTIFFFFGKLKIDNLDNKHSWSGVWCSKTDQWRFKLWCRGYWHWNLIKELNLEHLKLSPWSIYLMWIFFFFSNICNDRLPRIIMFHRIIAPFWCEYLVILLLAIIWGNTIFGYWYYLSFFSLWFFFLWFALTKGWRSEYQLLSWGWPIYKPHLSTCFLTGCHCKRSGCLKNYCECYEVTLLTCDRFWVLAVEKCFI